MRKKEVKVVLLAMAVDISVLSVWKLGHKVCLTQDLKTQDNEQRSYWSVPSDSSNLPLTQYFVFL